MLSHITKRNVVKSTVAVVANAVTCQITESLIAFASPESESDSTTAHYVSLGAGTAIYYSTLHPRLMHAIDHVADRRIARKAEKEATATA